MHNGKPVSTTSDCCGCGGGGPGSDWPIDVPPDRDGVYLIATPCPGVTPLNQRVLVFIPRGTAQPAFPCTTFEVQERCYQIGNTSGVVLDPLPNDLVVPAPDLTGPTGISCCECRVDCGTSTIRYYVGADYCSGVGVDKKCCCGCHREYSVTIAEEEKIPRWLSDGNGSGRWDYDTKTKTRNITAVWDNCGIELLASGTEEIKTENKLWSPIADNQWELQVSGGTTEASYIPEGLCEPIFGNLGLECGIAATFPNGYNGPPALVQARHDCKEHTGVYLLTGKDQGFDPTRPLGPDYFFTVTFTSTISTTDNACSGGCQGGVNGLLRSMLGMTPAEILEALG